MKIQKIIGAFLGLSILASGCTPDPSGGPSCNVVMVTGNITTPTTWTTGNVYMIDGDITVSSVLTIQPGVVVKLDGARLDVIGSGKILANGTASNHIVFTSYADDSYCGDNNGDGTATTPQKGDWTSIYLNGGINNTFTYCDIFYAGQSSGGYYNAVVISVAGPAFIFDHCTIAHTLSNSVSGSAYAFHGGSYMNDASVSVFTNNVFYDNDRPLYCSFAYTLDPSNTFHNPANPAEINKRNGIYMWGNGGNGLNVSYNVSEIPYVLEDNFTGGGSGSMRNVNIGNNVTLKFQSSSWGIARGSDNFINMGSGVVFTSYKDDAHGGDTNGDGNITSPAVGDWWGFYDYETSSYVSGSYIFYAAN